MLSCERGARAVPGDKERMPGPPTDSSRLVYSGLDGFKRSPESPTDILVPSASNINVRGQILPYGRVRSCKSEYDCAPSLGDNPARVEAVIPDCPFKEGGNLIQLKQRFDVIDRFLLVGFVGELRHPHHRSRIAGREIDICRLEIVKCCRVELIRRKLNKSAH